MHNVHEVNDGVGNVDGVDQAEESVKTMVEIVAWNGKKTYCRWENATAVESTKSEHVYTQEF